MMYSIKECDCTINYNVEGPITGLPTLAIRLSKGIYSCPNCGKVDDSRSRVYSIIVRIFDESDGDDVYRQLEIIGGEDRINNHWDNEPENYLIRKVLEDYINDCADYCHDDWLKNHRVGTFNLEVYYYGCMSDYGECGSEWDEDFEFLEETEVLP